MRNSDILMAIFVASLVLAMALAGCSRDPDAATLTEYGRAAAAFDAGRFDEASAAAGELGSFYPAAILLGKARWFLGDDAAAEAAFRSALRLRSSSTEARLGLARVLRSASASKVPIASLETAASSETAGAAEAVALVEAVLADDASDTRALRLAAELALDRGETRAAAAFLDRAAEAAGETGLAFLDRARLLWASGDGEGARRDVAAAIAVLPYDSAASAAARSLESALRERTRGSRP